MGSNMGYANTINVKSVSAALLVVVERLMVNPRIVYSCTDTADVNVEI